MDLLLFLRELETLKTERERARFTERFPTPGEFAMAIAPHATRQTPALEAIDRELARVSRGEINRLMIFCPPQEGKLVADDEPVPTPSGWLRHGDLRAGDVVFHPSGRQIKVAEVHAPAQATLRVHFSDHTSVLVHPAHEWTVWDRGLRKYVTRETQHLAHLRLDSGEPGRRGHRYRFQLPFREPLDLPDANLPIEPYTLGVWLGDGSSSKAAITHHPADSYLLAYPQSARCVHPGTGIITTYYRGGMRADLKTAGVYRNKHIPTAYLRASENQRRALLAGLIDTDGHVSTSGQVSFDNTNEHLVRDTAELIRTLGYRAHVHRPTAPKLSSSGIQGVQEMWRVTYTPHDQGPARLERKAAGRLGRRERIAITAITEEAPQTGRCITVESDDGLYLVGRGLTPTHNSSRMSCWYPLWRLAADPSLRIAIVSYNQQKAVRWGRWLRRMIEKHPELGITLESGSRAVDRFETTAGGRVLSVGISGGVTGEAVDLLLIDDPVEGRAEAESPTYRQRAWDWWESNAMTRASNRFSVILAMTRWSADDLAGRLLKYEPQEWNVLRIPAIREDALEPVRGNDGVSVYRPNGELVSVQDRPEGWFYKLRDLRSAYVWRSVYAQNPVQAEGNLFRRGDFRYWYHARPTADRRDELGGMRVRLGPAQDNDPEVYRYIADMHRFITMDLAASVKSSADWTVAAVWGLSPDGHLFLLDQDRQRLEEADHFGMVRPLAERWATSHVYVEKGFIGSTLVIDATRAGLRVEPVTPDKDKVTRAIPAANRARQGRTWLPAGAEYLDDWLQELAEFPAGAHDDRVDCLAYAERVRAAHWLEPDNRPVPRPNRYPDAADRAYVSSTGTGHIPDLTQAQW